MLDVAKGIVDCKTQFSASGGGQGQVQARAQGRGGNHNTSWWGSTGISSLLQSYQWVNCMTEAVGWYMPLDLWMYKDTCMVLDSWVFFFCSCVLDWVWDAVRCFPCCQHLLHITLLIFTYLKYLFYYLICFFSQQKVMEWWLTDHSAWAVVLQVF